MSRSGTQLGSFTIWLVSAWVVSACGSSETKGDSDTVAGAAGISGSGGATLAANAGGNAGALSSSGGRSATTQAPLLKLGLTEPPPTGNVTDARDGRIYRWVELNGVRWMAENLHFELPEGDIATCQHSIASDTSSCEQYGIFYGWSAAHAQPRIVNLLQMDLADGTYQGICPAGWHLPTEKEWQALFDYANARAGFETPEDLFGRLDYDNLSDPFRSTEGWENRPGTNELSFDVKPYTEDFIGSNASFWLSHEVSRSNGAIVEILENRISLGDSDLKEYRHSVRCIEGQATASFPKIELPPAGKETSKFTDVRDGRVYYFTQIDTQKWMAENLAYLPESGFSTCYAGQEEHCRIFGRFYDRATAQTVCPAGWHLPTEQEWRTLLDTVDSQTDQAGSSGEGFTRWTVGNQLQSMHIWASPPTKEPPFGFNALPAGFTSAGSASGTLGKDANFWVNNPEADMIVQLTGSAVTLMPVRTDLEYAVRCLAD